MKCPQCGKNKAKVDPQYGVLPCSVCQEMTSQGPRPKRGPEFTRETIKEGRREYFRDALQPFRGDILSKEYLEEFGTKGIKPTKKQLKNARYVWKDIPGWHNRHKTKGGNRNRKLIV